VKAARAAGQSPAPTPSANAQITQGSPAHPAAAHAAHAAPAHAPDDSGALDDAGAEYYERLDAAASGQRISIIAIVLTIGLRGVVSSHATSAGVAYALALAIGVLSLVGTVRMCSGLAHEQGRKIFCMAMAFVPVANIVTLVVLSIKVTRLLRQAGWRVGLFGARP
jgi:hypothetical protein